MFGGLFSHYTFYDEAGCWLTLDNIVEQILNILLSLN